MRKLSFEFRVQYQKSQVRSSPLHSTLKAVNVHLLVTDLLPGRPPLFPQFPTSPLLYFAVSLLLPLS